MLCVPETPSPTKVPLVNIPIGKPWEMIAVDVLQVPVSYHNNQYLLVIQDYFTSGPRLRPCQTSLPLALQMSLLKSSLVPDTLHLDQGRNFESTRLLQTLEAFGVSKSQTTAYHPKVTEWSSHLIGHSSRCFGLMSESRLIGNIFFSLSCLHFGQWCTHPQEFYCFNLCLADDHRLRHLL